IATFSPTSALVNVDLPTLGRPTRATNPARCTGRDPASSAAVLCCAVSGAGREPGASPAGVKGSVIGALLVGVMRVGSGLRGPGDDHGRQPPAASRGLLRLEDEAVRLGAGADDRHLAERLAEQTADAVDVVVLDLEVEQIPDLGQPGAGRCPVAAAAEVLDLGLVRVVLVGDL